MSFFFSCFFASVACQDDDQEFVTIVLVVEFDFQDFERVKFRSCLDLRHLVLVELQILKNFLRLD